MAYKRGKVDFCSFSPWIYAANAKRKVIRVKMHFMENKMNLFRQRV